MNEGCPCGSCGSVAPCPRWLRLPTWAQAVIVQQDSSIRALSERLESLLTPADDETAVSVIDWRSDRPSQALPASSRVRFRTRDGGAYVDVHATADYRGIEIASGVSRLYVVPRVSNVVEVYPRRTF